MCSCLVAQSSLNNTIGVVLSAVSFGGLFLLPLLVSSVLLGEYFSDDGGSSFSAICRGECLTCNPGVKRKNKELVSN